METTASVDVGHVNPNVLGLNQDVVRVIVFTNQFLCGIISFLGLIANVVNTVVYYKQGKAVCIHSLDTSYTNLKTGYGVKIVPWGLLGDSSSVIDCFIFFFLN